MSWYAWFTVYDISQLEVLGSKEMIRNEINELIFPLNTNANTYKELLEVINCLKKNWVGFTDEFFVNESKKYEYILTKLEGERRNELLGITDQMYENQELAKKWYKNMVKYIHPDIGKNDKNAFLVLQELYDTMKCRRGLTLLQNSFNKEKYVNSLARV